ncbi:Palmitoyltransferase [Paramicrosporidium saccamoebae]|uniref:Palmitoyltransferase n=1 Tax=Paramicrosporidium saccamoebae TaxID=1246581 RepID=A0A2H9TQ74_9FUNG|nr:Palmitoyltransferase [Paramicrosporidium saccamoebae]
MAVRKQTINWDIAISTVAVLLLVYVWASSHIYIFIPWAEMTWRKYKLGWVVYLGTINLLLVMSFWSFFAVALTSPGEVSREYRTDSSERRKHLRLCKKCDMIKPPRAHHCSHGCGSCILKMDHHCPWVANCIGFWNHGHFLRYTAYTWLAALLTECGIGYRLVPIMPISLSEGLVLIFNGILLFAVLILLGILLITTIKNIMENCTTIERLEVSHEKYSSLRNGHEQVLEMVGLTVKAGMGMAVPAPIELAAAGTRGWF